MAGNSESPNAFESFKHDEATRTNIPSAEYQSVLQKEQHSPLRVAYERRNRDLDRQIKEARRAATTALTPEERLAGQTQITAFAARRNEQWHSLVDTQDQITTSSTTGVSSATTSLEDHLDNQPRQRIAGEAIPTSEWRRQ
jgi:hypothetical protein